MGAVTRHLVRGAAVKFSGHDCRPEDYERLAGQMKRVFDYLLRGAWSTVEEIGVAINAPDKPHSPEASISAQLRNLRKKANGNWIIEGRTREGTRIYEYRLTGQRTSLVEQEEMRL